MARHTTTAAGQRMNVLYDDIRVLLRDMPPSQAEIIREEIIVIMVMMKVEVQKWQDRKASRSAVYRDGSVVEAVGADYDAMLQVARLYATDLNRLLT